MKKKYADYLVKLVLFTAALFLVWNFSVVEGFATKVLTVTKPILCGIVFYMVMAVPYDFFLKKVFAKVKYKKLSKVLSLVLTLILFGGALTLLGVLTVPQSIESVREISERFSQPNAWDDLAAKNTFLAFLVDWGKKGYVFLSVRFTDYVPAVFDAVKTFFTGVYNVLFGVFIGIMLLTGRESVKRQFKNLVLLLMSETKGEKIFSFLHKTVNKFSRYLGGQATEAFILGTACYLTMLLLKVPYPALVGFLIGFGNLIPIVGAYAAGVVCGILIFAVSPIKCLIFVIAVFILQQIEAFTTYPIIVGKYVGLSGFWIAASVLVWGGLFGFWGLLLGVPVTAVLQDLLREKSLRRKKISEKGFEI